MHFIVTGSVRLGGDVSSDFQHLKSRCKQDACSQASAAAAGDSVADSPGSAGEVREEGVRGDAGEVPAVRRGQDRQHLQGS